MRKEVANEINEKIWRFDEGKCTISEVLELVSSFVRDEPSKKTITKFIKEHIEYMEQEYNKLLDALALTNLRWLLEWLEKDNR